MPTRFASFVVVAATCGLAALGTDVGARASAQSGVLAFLHAHPDVHVAGFEVSAFGRGVVLHDVALPGATIRKLRLSRPVPRLGLAQAMAEESARA